MQGSHNFLSLVLSLLFFCSFSLHSYSEVQTQDNAFLAYSSLEDRTQLLHNLHSTLKDTYVSYYFKKEKLKLDPENFFKEAVLEEKKAIEEREAQLATLEVKSSYQRDLLRVSEQLAFRDRLLKLLAQFQGTHLRGRFETAFPTMYLALKIVQIQGRFYVRSLQQEFLEQVDSNISQKELPAPGDQILGFEIQGEFYALQDLVEDLVPYISGSSLLGRRALALKALTQRNFFLPEHAEWKVQFIPHGSEKVLSYPLYWTYKSSREPRWIAWAQSRAYRNLESLSSKQDVDFAKLLTQKESYTPADVQDAECFKSQESHLTVFCRGFYTEGSTKERAYYLKLRSFDLKAVYGADRMSLEGWIPIVEWLKASRDEGLPLILDLRENYGGRSRQAYALVQMIRGYDHESLIYSALYRNKGQSSLKKQSHKSLLRSDLEAPLFALLESRGAMSPIVLLQDPRCASACDLFVQGLSGIDFVHQLGQATMGAFSGYQSEKVSLNQQASVWKDSTKSFFTVKIPNVMLSTLKQEFFQEGRPVEPEHYYEADVLEDLVYQDRGWLRKAMSLVPRVQS